MIAIETLTPVRAVLFYCLVTGFGTIAAALVESAAFDAMRQETGSDLLLSIVATNLIGACFIPFGLLVLAGVLQGLLLLVNEARGGFGATLRACGHAGAAMVFLPVPGLVGLIAASILGETKVTVMLIPILCLVGALGGGSLLAWRTAMGLRRLHQFEQRGTFRLVLVPAFIINAVAFGLLMNVLALIAATLFGAGLIASLLGAT